LYAERQRRRERGRRVPMKDERERESKRHQRETLQETEQEQISYENRERYLIKINKGEKETA
jgi:hypothetical protein